MKYLSENPNRWITFYPQTSTSFYVEKAGYFDERPEITTSVTQLLLFFSLPFLLFQSLWFLLLTPFLIFGWGKLFINLPIRTGIEDCDSAAWGFAYTENTLLVYTGGAGNFEGGRRCTGIDMPWSLTWVRTSTLMKDGSWFNETPKYRKKWSGNDVGSYEWLEENQWQETHPFIDKTDNESLNATISVEEREWRLLWLKWTSLFAKKRKEIKVEFSAEVGKKKDSWKGGCIGCSYDLKPNETPYECLMRMQEERDF